VETALGLVVEIASESVTETASEEDIKVEDASDWLGETTTPFTAFKFRPPRHANDQCVINTEHHCWAFRKARLLCLKQVRQGLGLTMDADKHISQRSPFNFSLFVFSTCFR